MLRCDVWSPSTIIVDARKSEIAGFIISLGAFDLRRVVNIPSNDRK